MPDRIELGTCLDCGEPVFAGSSEYVYPTCRCIGHAPVRREDAPTYIRVRLMAHETEETLRRTQATLARVNDTILRVRVGLGDTPPLYRVAEPAPVPAPEVPAKSEPAESVYEQVFEDGLSDD